MIKQGRCVNAFTLTWLLLTLWLVPSTWATTIYEIRDDIRHGNCRVWTQVNLLTDDKSHILVCKQVKHKSITGIAIESKNGEFITSVDKGASFRPPAWYQFIAHRVTVFVRIDEGTPIRQKWHWDSETMRAVTADESIAERILRELPRGQRLVLQIEETPGQIILYGSFSAVNDFRSRIWGVPQ